MTATLTVAIPVDVNTLDPRRGSDAVSFTVINQFSECLVGHRPGSLEVEPALATSWSSTANDGCWRFQLRDDLRLSDGSPLGAAEIAAWLAQGRPLGATVRAVGQRELEFQLRRPSKRFPEWLAQLYYAVARPTDGLYLGTGPYRLVERHGGRQIVLDRNPHFVGKAPGFDRLVFQVVSELGDLVSGFERHTIDLSDAVTPAMLSTLEGRGAIRLEYETGLNTGVLSINVRRGPLIDRQLRFAIAHALDRGPLLARFLPVGKGQPATSLLPPRLWPGRPARFVDHDPNEARRRIAASQYRGEPLRLCPTWAPRPYMPNPEEMAREISAMLDNVGIRTRIEPKPSRADFFQRQQKGDFDLMLWGWIADDPAPGSFLADNLSIDAIGSTNITGFGDAEFEQALEVVRREKGSPAERAIATAERRIREEVPLVPILHGPQIAAIGPRVRGRALNPAGLMRLADLAPA